MRKIMLYIALLLFIILWAFSISAKSQTRDRRIDSLYIFTVRVCPGAAPECKETWKLTDSIITIVKITDGTLDRDTLIVKEPPFIYAENDEVMLIAYTIKGSAPVAIGYRKEWGRYILLFHGSEHKYEIISRINNQ